MVKEDTKGSERQSAVHHFGVHLTIDAYGGDPQPLADRDVVFRLLDTLPDKIGMRKLEVPHVLDVPPQSEKDGGGLSGFVIVAQSHVSIHTFPDRRFLTADVYTCQEELAVDTVLDVFKQTFALETIERQVILRGREYNKQVAAQL